MITIAMNVLTLVADAAAAPAAPSGGAASPFGGNLLFPLIIIMGIFMFFSFNSKRKQDKERQALLGSMKRGDRVQTIGGILGTVVEVRDGEVVVKVDENTNTKIKFARSAISRVTTEEDKGEAAK